MDQAVLKRDVNSVLVVVNTPLVPLDKGNTDDMNQDVHRVRVVCTVKGELRNTTPSIPDSSHAPERPKAPTCLRTSNKDMASDLL